ncbi:MAG: DUF502 domain-containing protein [Bdellovibrionaceae bacterium]|nr:DUF502 domain-containing protein [Bdellovibrionales bacterium]MCB9083423.1 DUF502 domain-containing protein [Pseudobdellovibrionaceae bacterium]
MMRSFLRIFGRGLFALLPTFLSIYILIRFFRWVDDTVYSVFHNLIPPEYYWPGMGFLAGILFIFFLGLALSNYFGNKLHLLIDRLFRKVPLVKSLYTAIQDLTDYFSPKSQGQNESQVVAVTWPDSDVQTIGLVTRTDLREFPDGINKKDRVAVFFPMSYQMGGFTVFLPKDRLTPLDMSVEKAMRSALTAWMKKDNNKNEPAKAPRP